MIDWQNLFKSDGISVQYKRNQVIFCEGNMPYFFFQILEGSVKMVSTSPSGKEFIQGMFSKNESFGEPVLFLDLPYPASAVANEDTVVLKVNKQTFLNLVQNKPDVLYPMTQAFAFRLYQKSIISTEIAIHSPAHRILTVLNLFKSKTNEQCTKRFKVEITRQQIADMVGLRVETTIRTIKALQKNKQIIIEKGHIFLMSD